MKYKLLGNLKHDGKNYSAGDVIDLDKKIAEPLKKDGLLVEIKNNKKKDESDITKNSN